MKVIICEDHAVLREEIKEILIRLFFEEEDVRIHCYEDGDELVRTLNREADFYADMVFMDIKMPKLDGIQTAKILRKRMPNTAIVFLTAHSEFVFLGYEIHAYDYILKPVSEGKLRKVVQRFMEEQQDQKKEYLLVHIKNERKRIPLEHVQYFVSDKRRITAIMDEPYKEVRFYMTMRELEERLCGLPFLRCHQSFLVNCNKVTDWNRTTVTAEDGVQIPISKKYQEITAHFLAAGNGCI